MAICLANVDTAQLLKNNNNKVRMTKAYAKWNKLTDHLIFGRNKKVLLQVR